MDESSNAKVYSFAKSMKSFPQDKIELDKMEKEKKTSFATLGRNSSGISITFSDDKEEFSKSRRGSMRDHQSRSGPGTPSRSRGISPSLAEEDMGSQLLSVRMKLEERRKRIEEEKKKMEMIMSKQREKVGQEAFLRAVAKGIKKAGHKEGGEVARSEILELASRVGEKTGGGQRACRPFSLHLETAASPPTQGGGSQSQTVSTPDLEANSISRMSDSLYELQSDLQRLALQQSQIQTMMSSSPHPHPPKPDHPPFFISQPPPSPPHPFYISGPPTQQYYTRPSWQGSQPGYHPPQHNIYEQHPPPPQHSHHPYIDQYGRQWGHSLAPPPNHHQPPPSHSHHPQPQMQMSNPHPPYSTYNPSHNQTYPPLNPPPQPYHSPGYPQPHSYATPNPPSYLPPKYSETSETPPNSQGSPFRSSLSRSSSLKRSMRSPHPESVSRNSAGLESRNSSSYLDTSDSNIDLNSTGSSQELMAPQQISFRDVGPSPSPPPRISLVPHESAKPPPMSEKPSLSTTFLEQKRKTLQAAQNTSLSSQVKAASLKQDIPPPSSSSSSSPSPTLELTQSTIDTLSTMKTQELAESSEHAKGFVISFDTSTPVKPKPHLKPRRSSKKAEDCGDDSVIGGCDTAQEVSEMDTVTVGDFTNNSLVIDDEQSANSVAATPDSEEFSGAEEICCVCEVRVGQVSISAVLVCESCSNYFNNVGSSVGEDITCVDGLNSCNFASLDTGAWCARCWVDKAGRRQLGVGESELVEKKKEWVMMMTVKRRQQAEEARIKREEEGRRRREDEESKKEELIRKKEDDKKRREEIFEAYKLKKEAEKAREEGKNFFSAKPGPKLRPKSAGGSRPRPRPNTIHVDHKDEVGITPSKMRGSQSNIAVSSGGFRTLNRVGGCRRGSNASLHDDHDGSGWGGSSLRGLQHIGRSKSSSASNLGPGSLPLGIRNRAARDFDDNASDVSSTTSGYRSGRGSAKLFREPVSKSNRPIIMNAVEYVVFPGVVNKETRKRVLEEIERCECPHFLILFRDSKLQFRGLYAYYPDTEEVFKIYGVGPRQVGDSMMDGYYKYNSGGKKFTQIHTKHLTVTIDGFTIHNSLWLGKKTKLPDKKEMALVI